MPHHVHLGRTIRPNRVETPRPRQTDSKRPKLCSAGIPRSGPKRQRRQTGHHRRPLPVPAGGIAEPEQLTRHRRLDGRPEGKPRPAGHRRPAPLHRIMGVGRRARGLAHLWHRWPRHAYRRKNAKNQCLRRRSGDPRIGSGPQRTPPVQRILRQSDRWLFLGPLGSSERRPAARGHQQPHNRHQPHAAQAGRPHHANHRHLGFPACAVALQETGRLLQRPERRRQDRTRQDGHPRNVVGVAHAIRADVRRDGRLAADRPRAWRVRRPIAGACRNIDPDVLTTLQGPRAARRA